MDIEGSMLNPVTSAFPELLLGSTGAGDLQVTLTSSAPASRPSSRCKVCSPETGGLVAKVAKDELSNEDAEKEGGIIIHTLAV
jgi:hypothetical protein